MFDETQPAPVVPTPQPEEPAPVGPAPESALVGQVPLSGVDLPADGVMREVTLDATPNWPHAELPPAAEAEPTLSVNGELLTAAHVAAILQEVQGLRTENDALRAELAERRAAG